MMITRLAAGRDSLTPESCPLNMLSSTAHWMMKSNALGRCLACRVGAFMCGRTSEQKLPGRAHFSCKGALRMLCLALALLSASVYGHHRPHTDVRTQRSHGQCRDAEGGFYFDVDLVPDQKKVNFHHWVGLLVHKGMRNS